MESNLRGLERLWHCIKRRLHTSLTWSEIPTSVAATEYLSLLRLALAPARIEACLCEGKQFLASTLPITHPGRTDRTSLALTTPPSESFFGGGPAAVEEWRHGQERSGDAVMAWVAQLYSHHFNSVGQFNAHRPLVGTRRCELTVYADSPTLPQTLDLFLAKFPFCELLDAADEGRMKAPLKSSSSIYKKIADPSIAGDRLFHLNLENLEEELAILVSGEVRDIWLLFPKKTDRSHLRFYTGPKKRTRILDYFRLGSRGGNVGDLIEKVLRGSQESRDDFIRLLTPCLTSVHTRLGLCWEDDAPLTPHHIECLAEKFRGWPTDVGIVSTLLATGCIETVPAFENDYRVNIYRYVSEKVRNKSADEDARRLFLAEKVFINLRRNLVEVPLLWSMTPSGDPDYTGVLLALFGTSKEDRSDQLGAEIQQCALEVRLEVERWYGRLGEYVEHHKQTRNTLGYFIHEVRNTLSAYKGQLPRTYGDALDAKLEAVFESHGFLQADDGQSPLEQLTLVEFERLVGQSVRDALGETRRIGRVEVQRDHTMSDGAERGYVELRRLLFANHLSKLLERSLQEVGNLNDSDIGEEGRVIHVRLLAESADHISVTISHHISTKQTEFIQRYRLLLGQEKFQAEGESRPHRGLYFFGEYLRNLRGEFYPPALAPDGNRVTWKLQLPFNRT